MILLFDHDSFYLHWRKINTGTYVEGKCKLCPDWPAKVIKNIGKIDDVKIIGYFLRQGNNFFPKPATLVTPRTLANLRKCVRFLPEYNDLTFKIVDFLVKKLPLASHIILCDTAFFVDLPDKTSNYAVPFPLREKGIKRYGGYGLGHFWAFQRISPFVHHCKKIVSLYIGNNTNVAAIRDGKPIETSIGFTPIEGILSPTRCGHIDPTIIFHLLSLGMSLVEINKMLSQKSGLTALLGKKAQMSNISRKNLNPKIIAAREIYCYNTAMYVGGCIALLGGIDAIVFFSEQPEQFKTIITEICHRLNFLKLKLKTNISVKNETSVLTVSKSPVAVFCLQYNKWKTMQENINHFLYKKGGIK